MELFTGLFFCVTAVFLIPLSLMMDTKNFHSYIIFKVIPLALGISAAFLALSHYGFVIQIG